MSPDTIVPTSTQGTQAWDRYAFVNNNPVRYTDPTGHGVDCGMGEICGILSMKVSITVGGYHSSLGTKINSTTVYTHNHFGNPPGAYNANGQAVAYSNSLPPLLKGSNQSRLMTVGGAMGRPYAPLASENTINSLGSGSVVQVGYWDDENRRVSVLSLGVTETGDGTLHLADPNKIINPGDSGGGVFYNGQLIGNTWSIDGITGYPRIGRRTRQFIPTGGVNVALLPSGLNNYDTATTPVGPDREDYQNME